MRPRDSQMSDKEYYELLDKVYGLTEDGMTLVLRERDCVGSFLRFKDEKETVTVTIHKDSVPFWVEFDKGEPIRLEDCPPSFYKTLVVNIGRGNYGLRHK